MGLILNIDTSTSTCSVALASNGQLLAVREVKNTRDHASIITVLIAELFEITGKKVTDIDAIAVCKGPGSFTGLRIGVSAAKGLCYAIDKPLISIGSPEILTQAFFDIHKDFLNTETFYCPLIDARRMEVYTALYNLKLEQVKETKALIVDENSFKDYSGERICFFGSGAEKCKDHFSDKRFHFFSDVDSSASYMANLSECYFTKKQIEDTAYFEPFYLKDFVATVAKKNVL